MYKRCRAAENQYKLVLTVLKGSTIERQLKVLEKYQMDVEVCVPQFSRLHSQWRNSTTVQGALDDRI